MNDRESYILLNMMEKVGPVSVSSLIKELGSASEIIDVDEKTLMNAKGIGSSTANAIVAQRDKLDLKGEIARAEDSNVKILTQIDKEYPEQLKNIYDPPLAIYVRGALKLHDKHAIAVVGSRRPTHYGRDMTAKLASQLGAWGYTVVSGLARGVDTIAHDESLKAGGRTVGVLGGGLDKFYPESNKKLAERMEEHGAVISEFPFARSPDRTTFPMRNRIISGLSMGVLVVEAGFRSGSLITAGQALEQGRSVFAVPGRVDSPLSAGTNLLIKDGATLVTDAKDIAESFDLLLPAMQEVKAKSVAKPLAADEADIVKILKDGERDVDSLIRVSGINVAKMSALLIRMEIKRLIRILPGRIVEAV